VATCVLWYDLHKLPAAPVATGIIW
jgi:hypothetical protein